MERDFAEVEGGPVGRVGFDGEDLVAFLRDADFSEVLDFVVGVVFGAREGGGELLVADFHEDLGVFESGDFGQNLVFAGLGAGEFPTHGGLGVVPMADFVSGLAFLEDRGAAFGRGREIGQSGWQFDGAVLAGFDENLGKIRISQEGNQILAVKPDPTDWTAFNLRKVTLQPAK